MILLHLCIYLLLFVTIVHSLFKCPNGAYILSRGMAPEDEIYAMDEHNRYRQMLIDGVFPDQPRAKSMKTMSYDRTLGDKCKPVSDQCVMNHLPVEDERWECVGQNIYISWHSECKLKQNWTAAIDSWVEEHNYFQYPNIATTDEDVGHYTQVVWANTDTVGCDYILFIDENKPCTPFCSMYTCNYAPCGNVDNFAPYETDDVSWQDSSCEYDYNSSEYESSSESDQSSSESDQSSSDISEFNESSSESYKTDHGSYHHESNHQSYHSSNSSSQYSYNHQESSSHNGKSSGDGGTQVISASPTKQDTWSNIKNLLFGHFR